MRAQLNRGLIQLRRFALSGRTAQLFATGTVTISGRLALDVTAMNGSGNLAGQDSRRCSSHNYRALLRSDG